MYSVKFCFINVSRSLRFLWASIWKWATSWDFYFQNRQTCSRVCCTSRRRWLAETSQLGRYGCSWSKISCIVLSLSLLSCIHGHLIIPAPKITWRRHWSWSNHCWWCSWHKQVSALPNYYTNVPPVQVSAKRSPVPDRCLKSLVQEKTSSARKRAHIKQGHNLSCWRVLDSSPCSQPASISSSNVHNGSTTTVSRECSHRGHDKTLNECHSVCCAAYTSWTNSCHRLWSAIIRNCKINSVETAREILRG